MRVVVKMTQMVEFDVEVEVSSNLEAFEDANQEAFDKAEKQVKAMPLGELQDIGYNLGEQLRESEADEVKDEVFLSDEEEEREDIRGIRYDTERNT